MTLTQMNDMTEQTKNGNKPFMIWFQLDKPSMPRSQSTQTHTVARIRERAAKCDVENNIWILKMKKRKKKQK